MNTNHLVSGAQWLRAPTRSPVNNLGVTQQHTSGILGSNQSYSHEKSKALPEILTFHYPKFTSQFQTHI